MRIRVHALTVASGYAEVQLIDRTGTALAVPRVLRGGQTMAVEPASGTLLQVCEATEEIYERYLREMAG